jgi:hypothetical protein
VSAESWRAALHQGVACAQGQDVVVAHQAAAYILLINSLRRVNESVGTPAGVFHFQRRTVIQELTDSKRRNELLKTRARPTWHDLARLRPYRSIFRMADRVEYHILVDTSILIFDKMPRLEVVNGVNGVLYFSVNSRYTKRIHPSVKIHSNHDVPLRPFVAAGVGGGGSWIAPFQNS